MQPYSHFFAAAIIHPRTILVAFATIACVWPTAAADTGVPLFQSHDPLALEITADFKAIIRDNDEEPEDRPATLTYADPQLGKKAFAIGVRQRGKSRRKKSVCRFPPLRLNFASKTVQGSLFHEQDKLKLVTHCSALGSPSKKYERLLHLEYLTYRIFNTITEASFRVRPVRIGYRMSGSGKLETHPAFLIESKGHLAARSGHVVSRTTQIHPGEHQQLAAAIVELFQYLIGNTDFSILKGPEDDRCCHNSVLFEPATAAQTTIRYLPAPYDFDATGFVDPPYAAPPINLRLKTVKTRLYRGFCRDQNVMHEARDRFIAAKPAIVATVSQYTPLDETGSRVAVRYLNKFFDTIEDPRQYKKHVTEKCRG